MSTPASAANERDLLPCPFCGAHLPHMWSLTPDGKEHRINCTECPGRAEFKSSTREQAIAAWNRRAIPQPAAEPVRVPSRSADTLQHILWSATIAGCAVTLNHIEAGQFLTALKAAASAGSAAEARVRRLLKAATEYANAYVQDEADPGYGPDDLVCSVEQHTMAVELFAAIAAMPKEAM